MRPGIVFVEAPSLTGEGRWRIVRLDGDSASGAVSLPLSATEGLPVASDKEGRHAREIACHRIDALIEQAARTGLTDGIRKEIASLARDHGLPAPKLP